MDDPLAVALKFGFLLVLYLFLLWVARSALKDLSRGGDGTAAAEPVEPPSPRRRGAPRPRPRGGVAPRLVVVAAKGYEPGTAFDVSNGAMMGRADNVRDPRRRPVRVVRSRANIPAQRLHVRGGHGLDQRHLPQRSADPHSGAPKASDVIRIGDTRIPVPRVSLRVIEQVGRTDVGRQRSVNEDSLVLSPPFFAVADGMGGAKAGEVASAMAAGAFEGETDSGEAPEAQLSRILREANRRIYDLAVVGRLAPRHGHDRDRRQGRPAARSASATSATAAPTDCATASSSS